MREKHILFLSLLVIAVVAIAGIPTKSQYYEINANGDPDLIAGRNVNMVSGMTLPDGDPYLQRQNEPSIAVSTRNPLHLLAGANDYKTVDMPGDPTDVLPGQMQNQSAGDAWLGVYKSFDGGQSWKNNLLDGYPQQQNSSSPLKGYQAAADPVVRAGTNGLFYYSGIVFDRTETANNAVFLARFIDNNNDEEGDSIQYIDTTIIDSLNGERFKDKPWIAVGIPKKKAKTVTIAGQKIPKSNVYIVYSVFKEVDGTQQSEILFCRSTDCGNTWEDPIVLSSGHYLNQGATIAVDPRDNGHLFVAWRRFASGAGQTAQTNAIVIARSTNEGKEFPDVIEVTEVPGPFDQPTSAHFNPLPGTAFRTNSYPTMAIDKKGRIYLAWSQRGMDPVYPYDSRVVIATSKDGFVWTTPMTVESAILSANGSDCHEFMPSIAFASGRLILAWYDTRNDYNPEISPEWIYDQNFLGAIRHTVDVRVAQGRPGEFPVFQPSVQVSKYLWAMWESSPGNYYFSQVQFNPPNYPLFKGGMVPFHGDYIEIAPSPPLIQTSKGVWRFNTESTDSQQFHLAWTDNRDVRPPENNNWEIYNPPNSSQSLSQSQFSVSTPCADPLNTGMRNQNVYTSLITSVMEAGMPGNNKPLGTLGTNPTTGDLIPRAFVIFVKNPTEDIRSYRLQITDGPDHGTASFLEFDMLGEIDVSIPPYSSISRPLFVTSTNENDTVTVEVFEIDEIGGSAVPGGAQSTLIINQDNTAPDVTGDLQDTESHDPDISNPNIVNWTYVNPNIVNPNIVNPNIVNPNIVNPNIVNPNIVNPNIVNPNIVNPNIVNPNIVNPNIVNPNIVNPNIVNAGIEDIADADVTDIAWPVRNNGNTISSYTFKIFARDSLPEGIYAQLLVYKVHYTPATDGVNCALKETPHHELLLNIVNPNIVNPNIVNPNIVNPNIVNSAIENATFFLSPGEEAEAMLRLIDPEPGTTKFLKSGRKFKIQQFAQSLGAATGSQALDSEDAQEGDTTVEADSTELIIITAGLPDGTVDEVYPNPDFPGVQLEAAGGDGTNVWSANSAQMPPGLGCDENGVIGGVPQFDSGVTYPHIYNFIVQVASGGESATQNLSITINSAEEPTPPLNIETTSLTPGTVGDYYGATLQATGGTTPRTWSITSGSLPLGLSLDSGGVISGQIVNDENVSYPHNYTFTVQVTDANTDTDTQALSISVDDIVYPDLTISGTVTDEYGSAVAGVSIYGLPYSPQTDSYGFYSDTVPHNWSGTITPFRAGYDFQVSLVDPSPSRTYNEITTDQYSQDFVATSLNYTISGVVTFYGSPLEGVTMHGLPNTPQTDANGFYFDSVPFDWSGTVTPELLDYIFQPPSRTYASVTADHVLQDYAATFVGVGQDDPFEENDDFANATDMTPGTYSNMQLHDDDWYRVDVTQGSDLKVFVDGEHPNNIDVEILDSAGNRIIGAYGDPQDETVYASELTAGWHYIRVIYLGTSGFWNSYDLTITTGNDLGNGEINGNVSNSTDDALENVEITAYDTQSDHYFATTTDTNGDYRLSLPPSWYKIFFDAGAIGPPSYVSEYYDNQLTFENAAEIDVQIGMVIIEIDAVLEFETVLSIVTTALPDGYLATSYSAQLEAIGGQTPYTWELADGSGPLPDGLVLNSSGLIDGTPTTLGTFPFEVELTDATPESVTQALSITINTYAGTEYVISGTVTPALLGVVMSGLPGNPETNSLGEYTALVYSGWSGTVTPILSNQSFDPPSRSYTIVSTSHTGENYSVSAGHTISGQVTFGGSPLDGIEGVLMSGLPTNPYTDENGQYSGAVPDNWSGTVTPILPGFTFNPANTLYTNVADDVSGEDYTANFAGGEDDAYEENDDYGSAKAVSLGTHMNLVLADEDWFMVQVEAGDAGKDLKINIKAHSYPTPNGYEDLDFIVVDESEKMLGYVLSSSDDETLYLTDIEAGWYYIGQTYISQSGTVYSLTLELSDNFGIGYVSGRVTDETTGQPIEGVYVELYGQPFDWGNSRPLVTTDENGEYKIGYTPGNYTVQFNDYVLNQDYTPDVNYIAKSYNSNEVLSVVAGTTIEEIDAELSPGGTITGRITDPEGNGQNNGLAFIYRSDTVRVAYAYTDGNGNYRAQRLPTGNYKVRARAGQYGSMWYDDLGSFEDGHPVPVQVGTTTPNIDLQLEESAIIEGRVTDSGQNPIQDVNVIAYDVSGIALWSGYTNAEGYYWVGRALPTGDVKLYFEAIDAQGNYASEYYTDKLLIEDADPISVQAGQTTSGIDAELGAGGTISGRVTDAQDDGFAGVNVHCFDINSDRIYGINTGADGNYTILGLQPGDYKVRFRATSGDYATQWYNGGNSFTEGNVVSVGAGSNMSGHDVQLIENGGFISGRVTNTSDNGIKDVRVFAQDNIKEGAIAWTETDADGYYTIPRIPTCNAKVYFNSDRQYLNHVAEWFNDASSHASAGLVSVTEGQETGGINAILAPIPSVNIETESLPNGEVAVPYEIALEATGGREFYHWSLISGNVPPGLTLNSKGEITGTPTTSGTHNFTVRVIDSSRNQLIDTQSLSITVDTYGGSGYLISGSIQIDSSPLGGVVLQGLPGNPVTSPNGEYIVAVSDGWSGTVTPTHSGYFFDPQNREYDDVDSSLSAQDYAAYELTLHITTEWLLNGTEGYPYNQSLSVEGGTESYSWSISEGNLPYGLTLDSDGNISGTPTYSDSFDFTVRVTDSSSPLPQYAEKGLSIHVHGDPVADYPLFYWKLDESEGTVVYDSSGNNGHGTRMGNVSYSTDSVDGRAAGILANGWLERSHQGPFHFVNQAMIFARVKIDFNQPNRFVWKLQYDEPHRGHPYSLEVSLDIKSDEIGDFLHLDSGNGLTEGIENCTHYPIDVNLASTTFVENQYNQIAVTINGDVYKIFINGAEVASATGAPFEIHDYIQNFWVGGADWSEYWLGGLVDEVMVFNMAFEPQVISEIYAMGVLPTISGTVLLSDGSPLPWVRMDNLGDVQVQEDGTYIGVFAPGWSGTVTPEMGGYFFDPQSRSYTDVTANITGQDYTAYEQGALWIETGWLPDGTKNQPYSTTLVAADGVPAYRWSIASGSLPAGLTLNQDGEISGDPAEAGDFSFTARVLDSDSPPRAAEQHLTLFISAAHQGFWSTTYPGGGEIDREGLAIDPADSNVIFAAASARGIFKSEDGGANWTNLNDDPDWPYGESEYSMFTTHQSSGNLYMSTWGFLYMSSDRGDSWQQIYSRENWDMISLAVDPTTINVIYVGTEEEGLFKTTDGGMNWSASSSGLPSDEIRVIAVNPNTSSTVYAGTRSNGIFKSITSGDSWTSTNNNIVFQRISDIVMNPNDSNIIFIAARDSSNDEGIFRSINGGVSWTKLPVNAGVDWSAGNYIAIDPTNTDIIYFASYQSVFKSIDGGDNWTESSTSSSPDTLFHLHFDGDLTGVNGEVPTQASGVTFEDGMFGSGAYFSVGNQVFYQSADNIDSAEGTLEFWIKPRWNGNDGQNHLLLQFGGEGGILFTKDGANNLRSILNLFGAGGNPEVGAITNVEDWSAHEWHHCAFTWRNDSVKLYIDGVLRAEEPVTFPLPVVNAPTFQMGADGTYSYLDAVIDELRISSIERSPQDIADSYMAGTMQNLNITSIVIDRQNPQTVYIGTQGEGVFKSENGGVSWTKASNGIRALHFVGESPHGLEIDKSDPDYIYAGSINGGYRSTNGGSSWETMGHPAGSILALLTHPGAPGVVYSFHNHLRINTSNGSGGSWDIADGFTWGFARGDIGIAADDPDLIYVGTWGSNSDPTGVYKTTDRGLNFTLMNNGLTTNTEVQTVAVHPGDHDIVFIGLRRNWPFEPGKDYGLYKTTDGGTSWDKITCGLPDDFFTRQIVFSLSNPNTMFMLGETDNDCGIYRSTDGGECWSKISWPCGNSIAVSPDNPDHLFLGAWNDFFVSLDGGNSWMEFNDGLPRNPGIDAIAIDPNDPQHVFIGTAAGVYEATFSFDFMIVTEELPSGILGEEYNVTLETAGGTGSITWEMVSGGLPDGLAFDETLGEISGTPLELGYFEQTIKATDDDGNSYTRRYSFGVLNKYVLTVGTNGGGSVTVDPDEPWYIEGSMVNVSVTIPQGYVFTGWSGDATGRATLVHVEMTRDKTLMANFALPSTLPDYDFSQFDAPGSVSAGATIGGLVSAEVRNQGAADPYLGDISVGIYLSPNPEITTSDMLLWKGRSSISAMSGGTMSVPIDANLQIPTTVSPGIYSIGILVDEFDVIAEQNEDNNFAFLAITITSAAYDRLEFLGQWHGGESNAVACDETRNLAFIGHGALLQVLDVSDPSHPAKIGEVALGTRGICDIEISGNTLYIAGDGFRIVDVSFPDNPSEIGYSDIPNLARGVVVSGNYAYVTDHFFRGLQVFDITNPNIPNHVNFTPFPGRTRGIAIKGNYLYLQAGTWLEEGETGIRIVDISTPSNPSQVNFYATEGATGWPEIAGDYLLLPTGSEGLHVLNISDPLNLPDAIVYGGLGNSGWISTNGNYAYVNDSDRNAIVVLNIADVNSVHEEGVYHFEDQTSINFMDVLGNHCYADGWYHSLKILDMSNPANPYKIGSYDGIEGMLRDVDASEDFAFITIQNQKGVHKFRTLNMSSLPNISGVGTFVNPSNMYLVRIAGNFAYVVTSDRELKVLDISDPSNPHEVAIYENFDSINDLQVSGNFAYVLDNFRGLQVFDISTPANPVFVSQWYTHPRSISLAISGNYAYVSALWAGVRIIDISDPMNPWEIGYYQAEDLRAYELAVSGNYAYVGDVDDNLRIIDVSDPQNPFEAGIFVTNTYYIEDIEVSGHIVFTGSYINGLMVIDVSDPNNPVKLDELAAFSTPAIAVKENRIYEIKRGSGLIVYEFRRK